LVIVTIGIVTITVSLLVGVGPLVLGLGGSLSTYQSAVQDRLGEFMNGVKTAETIKTVTVQVTPATTTTSQSNSSQSPLNDKTLYWNSYIHRPWLSNTTTTIPPYMLLITNYGWNQPNQTLGIQIYRCIRMREFHQAIVNHPYFYPHSWDTIAIRNDTRYYIFLDRDTCRERNYPYYGNANHAADTVGGRGTVSWNKWAQQRAMDDMRTRHETIVQHSTTVLLELDCSGWGPLTDTNSQINMNRHAVASISAHVSQHRAGIDMGLPPPPVKPCTMTPDQRLAVTQCMDHHDQRPLLLSFAGKIRYPARHLLKTLTNHKTVLIYDNDQMAKFTNISDHGVSAKLALSWSQFGAAPRGDNLFSYRFPEVLSCGAIPVVHSDGWVLPFAPELINWTEAMVLIPEKEILQTVDILSRISKEDQCRMRQRGMEIYDKYLATAKGTIDGLIETMELRYDKYKSFEMNVNTAPQTPAVNLDLYPDSPLHDKTLRWSNDVDRLWLYLNDSSSTIINAKPPAMLLLTDQGWNRPNRDKGIEFSRSLRTTELYEGIINHAWFHPKAWSDIKAGRMAISNETRYYVFMDRDTIQDASYPQFNKGGTTINMDTRGGRGVVRGRKGHDAPKKSILRSSLFLHGRATLIDFFGADSNRLPLSTSEDNLVHVVLSAKQSQIEPLGDLGLPPPAINPCVLSSEQRASIERCDDESTRSLLLSFSGNLRPKVRKELVKIHNGKTILILGYNEMAVAMKEAEYGAAFQKSLSLSVFGAAPRGDALVTYRFSEIMSCGAIPVVYADDWVLPFGYPLVNWTDVVIRIPENETHRTVAVLSSISTERRCQLRRNVLKMYDTFMKTGSGVIDGIVRTLELRV
jgi:hypothetical protein